MADGQVSTHPSPLRTYLWLGLIMVLAFVLRSLFNIEAGFDAETARHMLTGNDPYYHWVTASHVLETGRNLDMDYAINYPEGSINHNPPLWTWLSALVAVLLKGMGVVDPVGTALNVMVAVWGALCIIPIYMIGRDLWGRNAGLWAALFLALSAPHITRTFWGYADHDAISIFFVLLAIAFLVRGFKASHHRIYVERWGDGAARGRGLRTAIVDNRNTLAYAVLAGLAISACAVTWKGYPYVIGILGLAAVLQFVVDHLRHRDATVAWVAYTLAALVAAVVPYLLYYRVDPGHLHSTVIPSLYATLGIAVAGLLLVPTRNLPSVLVMPSLIVAGILGYVALVLFLPSLANVVFSGLGYFNQSKLYSTIGEAQRPLMGTVAANLGFFAFLASFWGFAHMIKRAYKGNPASVLVTAWAIIALFMMFAAARFIVNAAPLFALAMGYVMVRITAKLGGTDVRKRFRSMHGQNPVTRSFRSLGWKTSLLSALVGLLLIVPTVWIAADAGMSQQFKCDADLIGCDPGETGTNHFGAFGQAYELANNGWLPAMQHLSTLDTDKPLLERPAFLAWWDYGHWARSIGQHPTVADPFQSHFDFSGRVLASDSEEEATAYLAALLISGDEKINVGKRSPALQQLLDGKGANMTAPFMGQTWETQMRRVLSVAPGDQVYAFYNEVMAATGKSVLYLGVDDRMGSFAARDGRYLPSADRGIFYAPVYLSDKNPDDYIQQRVQAAGQQFTVRRYEMVDGVSRDTGVERFFDTTGQEWTVYQGQLYRMGQTPRQGFAPETGLQLSEQGNYFEPTPKFGQTMFARAFGGIAKDGQAAGNGLSHWRVIHESIADTPLRDGTPHRQVALLQYYNGAVARGSVVDESGKAMAGVRVTFADGFGATHGSNVTDKDGRYEVRAPFSQGNDLRLTVAGSDGSILWQSPQNDTAYQFTLQEAMDGVQRDLGQAVVPNGSLTGTVYAEGDSPPDNTFNRTGGKDRALMGAKVTVGDRTAETDADGNFTIDGLQAGTHTVVASYPGYQNATRQGQVPSGGSATVLLPMTPLPSAVTFTFQDTDGTPVGDIPLRLTGPNGYQNTLRTNATGVIGATLAPGAYQVTVDHNVTDAQGTTVRYEARKDFQVEVGGAPMAVIVERR